MKTKPLLVASVTLATGLLIGACSSSATTAATTTTPKTTAATAPAITAAPTTKPVGSGPSTTTTKPTLASLDAGTILATSASFKTLSAMLTTTGLIDTIKATGPITVFAPTDAAFAKLDKALLDKLSKNPSALKIVLRYHIVNSKVLSADLAKLTTVTTLEGGKIGISKSNTKVMLDNKATISKADTVTKNGVIQVIDTVLIPSDLTI